MNALWAKNKIGFVDRTILKPDQTKPVELVAWKKCNLMVISWICNALTKDLHDSVAYMDDSQMKAIWDELSTYIPMPVYTCCTCGMMKDLVAEREKDRIYQFLMDLNDRFSTILSNILGIEPLPSAKGGSKNAKDRPKLCCDHCKMTGPGKDRFYELIGYPPGWDVKGNLA
ncbi:PREDICTED: uncharacterized protein LOC104600170 [Nelumbo nucifera]|uniref:Uncharacterized protein LOC104600170 n=1 Tax=Nelumbo nucifera TaxID=4432 RepID=A0A1U8Q6S5_NELNU|nr:PREDICTED: uncharacterized protein LOC104600170 [Nelumbo nucifera]